MLENSAELERAYASAAAQGQTVPPENPEDEVDFHYVCFARSRRDGQIYELDGDKPGPVGSEVLLGEDEDLLSQLSLAVVRDFTARCGADLGFNLLALAEEGGNRK